MPSAAAVHPDQPMELEDHFIDEFDSKRVVVIGAGIAGILAGILLPKKVPNVKLTIYEKNEDFGGTWLENTYPGVRCDIPGHVYQSTFAPNSAWSEMFPRGQEILDYWRGLAEKYEVQKNVVFGHKIQKIEWLERESVWKLDVLDIQRNVTHTTTADFVLTAIGRFNDWKVPNFPNKEAYKGQLVHTANWPENFDVKDKNVAVIGNGSSGIQILPNIQPIVKRLDHFARNPTWIASSWAGDDNAEKQGADQPNGQTSDDAADYLSFRKEMTDKYWRRFDSYMRGTEENVKLREACVKGMKEEIASEGNGFEHPIPNFPPNCRRLTPGPGYIKAISQPNVNYIRSPIKRLTESGLETEDGEQHDVDVIICATGFNIDMAPPFSIVSGGRDLKEAWKHDGEYGSPFTYFGIASPGFPNLFFIHGPHGTGLAGLVPHSCETQLTYMSKILRKMAREGIKSIQPSLEATEDFQEYSDSFFAHSVLSDNCSSWYNGGRPGVRIHGLWPGSSAHATIARKDPRWEDFDYKYRSSSTNRFAYFFGNGRTKKEADEDSDMTDYLQLPERIDLKSLHEEWWRFP